MAASGAAGAGEAVGEDAAAQIGPEPGLDETGYAVSQRIGLFGPGEVGLQVLTDEPVEDGALGATPAVDARSWAFRAHGWSRCLPHRLEPLSTWRIFTSGGATGSNRRRGWERAGHRSCARWLSFRTGFDVRTARDHVRMARALEELPRTGRAMARGGLSFSQVRTLTRVATPETEAELLELAEGCPTLKLERLVRAWRKGSRQDEVARERERHRLRPLSVFPDDDGRYVVRGRLTPEVGALLQRALEAAEDALYRRERAAGREPFDGSPGEAAAVRVSRGSDGSVLDVGRRRRTVPPALRGSLEVRDRGCRFPGCGLRFADAHHVTHWADGGETSLENSVHLCRRHHRLVHEEGWSVEWWGKDRAVFTDPRGGQHLDRRPPPPELPERPIEALVAENRGAGADPGPLDAGARWRRERDVPHEVWFPAVEAGMAATAPPVAGVGPAPEGPGSPGRCDDDRGTRTFQGGPQRIVPRSVRDPEGKPIPARAPLSVARSPDAAPACSCRPARAEQR